MMNDKGKNEALPRVNICICGRMNAGKSTLMNLITGQETSIVHSAPGTTADVVTTVMEIHDYGPVKIFDTAGLDETGGPGEKKREKALISLKESDIVLVVVSAWGDAPKDNFEAERKILSLAVDYKKRSAIVMNLTNNERKDSLLESIPNEYAGLEGYPFIGLDLSSGSSRNSMIEFIKGMPLGEDTKPELIPFLEKGGFVALNIPVDEETPAGRLLRPQNLVMDYILRKNIPFAGIRMDLEAGRSSDPERKKNERERYTSFINELNGKSVGLQLIITDSQAIDLIAEWTPPEMKITTFSIIMANSKSGGCLNLLAEGLEAMDELSPGDRILIAELCNHDRKAEDIGTVQIPRLMKSRFPEIQLEFSEGRFFPSEKKLGDYKLVIQCGGCMVDDQKYKSRIEDCRRAGVRVTNYGLVLSWLHDRNTLQRVLHPWKLS